MVTTKHIISLVASVGIVLPLSAARPENVVEIPASQIGHVIAGDSIAPAGSEVPMPRERHSTDRRQSDTTDDSGSRDMRHADRMPVARRQPTASDTITRLMRDVESTHAELDRTRVELDNLRIRYANSMLSQKYKELNISKAIEEFDKVTDPELKNQCRQLRQMLVYYPAGYNELLDYLEEFHGDPRKRDDAGRKNWYVDALGRLRALDVYKKVNSKGFVILYLKDFVIEAERRLKAGQQKNDPAIGFKDIINVLQVDRPKVSAVSVGTDRLAPVTGISTDIDIKDIDTERLD